MRAEWITETGKSTGETISEETLRANGVQYAKLSLEPEKYQPALEALKISGGYIEQDEVALHERTENLDELLKKFIGEHLHTEDEVRFVLSGSGVFDIRSTDDRWMQVEVTEGDLIVVPKDRYHRFKLTDARKIQCVRLFQETEGWTPQYRQDSASASAG